MLYNFFQSVKSSVNFFGWCLVAFLFECMEKIVLVVHQGVENSDSDFAGDSEFVKIALELFAIRGF